MTRTNTEFIARATYPLLNLSQNYTSHSRHPARNETTLPPFLLHTPKICRLYLPTQTQGFQRPFCRVSVIP